MKWLLMILQLELALKVHQGFQLGSYYQQSSLLVEDDWLQNVDSP